MKREHWQAAKDSITNALACITPGPTRDDSASESELLAHLHDALFSIQDHMAYLMAVRMQEYFAELGSFGDDEYPGMKNAEVAKMEAKLRKAVLS